MKNAFYLLCVILISSCNSSKSKSTQQKELNSGTYKVTRINSDDVTSMDVTFILNKEEKRVSGNAGCNDYSATITMEGATMTTSEAAMTKKYCDGKMEVEKAFASALNGVQSYKMEGNVISLLDSSGEAIIEMK
ncbi:META domain-containing protein [Dokdonia sinensis]|uniref:META domain-containing protein n=1 Tax=Dokdonia sinensis TaxID=2479847 RepID=A0A3M0GH75_9FLAO|nr:META domain-containing protein [Dokdonia sinensis]RMB60933.1 META domain-containing protein [Dokdonia sinensis]